MRKRVDRFSWVFYTQTGNKVLCEVSDPSGSENSDGIIPRRQFTVNHGAALRSGDVISGQGALYLVSKSSTLAQTWRFKGYEITHIVPLVRQEVQTDLVTNLKRSTGTKTINPALPIVVEPMSFAKNQGIEDDRYKVLSGTELLPGDKLADWVVQTVRYSNGVYLAEVS